MKVHPAAEIFPEMQGDDFDAFCQDIKEHGQLEAIVVYGDMILDGRNRWRACQVLGIQPLTVPWDHNNYASPEQFVVSKNLHRRHLNETQRAMVAARLTNVKNGWNYRQKEGGEIPLARAAELLNVNRSTVVYAKKVLSEGSPEEIQACDNGEASVNTIGRQIGKVNDPLRRKNLRDREFIQKGKNPERIQKQQMRAELWNQIRDALIALSTLPDPAETAAMVRSMDKGGLIDKRLPLAIMFLQSFEEAWKCREAS